MVGFFSRLFKPKGEAASCLQRSRTELESDSDDDELEGTLSAPETERRDRDEEPEAQTSIEGRVTRRGGELRRSQTFTARSDVRREPPARISTSSCDSCSPDDPLRLRYSKVTQRHRGKMATILQGVDRKTKRPVIIKAFCKSNMSASLREKIDREQAVLKAAASCQGIVKMLGVVEDVTNNYVVLESVAGQTLIELMAWNGGRLPEARCVTEIVHPLFSALASLHELGIVHRDIKPEHIMCCSPLGIKLVDFIHSAQKKQQCLNCRIGSLEYMAPEVVTKPSADEVFHQVLFKGMSEDELAQYDEKVDVWSAGVVVFEALTGQQPFPAEDLNELQAMQRSLATDLAPDGVIPKRLQHEALSPLAQSFVAEALRPDPAKRPSAAKLLQHPWVCQYVGSSRLCSRSTWLEQGTSTSSISEGSTTSDFNRPQHQATSGAVRVSCEMAIPAAS